ncbi:PLD nuclease N-terminal domain-containing protein [Rhodococcus sp. NPDC058505]|uniref:PLD nuclease N-terminal domain-containing protein n=1 Tax=unclassified Rhodococcus (in: high G+C Gram-positive bacteria) TaxID=192944 RepID=UPI00365F213F
MTLIVLAGITALVWVWPVVDVHTRAPWQVRVLPRTAWLAVTLLLPGIGGALWLLVGRPRRPMPLPEQHVHPAVHFARERERAREQALLDEEDEFRRRFRERVADQRQAGHAHRLELDDA